MATAAELWLRVPVLPRAVVVGIAVGAAGTVPWAVLLSLNLKYLSAVPWAVPVMAVYLSLFWLYFVRGSGWPRSTAAGRRADARANDVPGDAWGPALFAGMPSLAISWHCWSLALRRCGHTRSWRGSFARLERRLVRPYLTMRDSVSNRRKLLYVATALISVAPALYDSCMVIGTRNPSLGSSP